MKLIYKIYEPNEGLEEKQARLYTELSGRNATAEEIQSRNTQRPKEMTRYVLTEDGEAIAYITARPSRSQPGRTYIGYPWAKEECPEKAQIKIFNDLMEYLSEHEQTRQIGTTIVLEEKNSDEQFKFFNEFGFRETEILGYYEYECNINEILKWKIDDDLVSLISRPIEESDVEDIVELIINDPYMSRAFSDKEGIIDYLRNRVISDGHSIVLLDDDEYIAASAIIQLKPDHPLSRSDHDFAVPRFSVIKSGYKHVSKKLIYELAKCQKEAGWENVPMHFSYSFISGHRSLSHFPFVFPNIEVIEVIMTYSAP